MDFYRVIEVPGRGYTKICASFAISRKVDTIMFRGGDFYAVWNPETLLWDRNEYEVVTIVDGALRHVIEGKNGTYDVKLLSNSTSGGWYDYTKWKRSVPDNYHELDQNLVFKSQVTTREDYSSKRLSYDLVDGDCPAWDRLLSKLYDEENRRKIEWAIGSVLTGASKHIQKFFVLWGPPGTGKSTILDIIALLFDGYWEAFRVEDMLEAGNQFALEPFKTNPLVAINADAKLSRVETNSLLNSVVAHEPIVMNEKHKAKYTIKVSAALFLGTNEPVKITDAKSGLIRRLIDISPTGERFEPEEYFRLIEQVKYELGQIAFRCKRVFEECGVHYYDGYKPLSMMYNTDSMFNFVVEYRDVFEKEDITLARAYTLYKQYCEDSELPYPMTKFKFREALKSYFDDYNPGSIRTNDGVKKCVYSGFKSSMLETSETKKSEEPEDWLKLEEGHSLLDDVLKDSIAQYANSMRKPIKSWDKVTTHLRDLDTSLTHYCLFEDSRHIVLDFDKKDENGNKSLKLNLEAARKFPKTYAEVSDGGNGLHLHYYWRGGDPKNLVSVIEDGIECKVYAGKSPLRRRVSLHNNVSIAEISSGIKEKEVTNTLSPIVVRSEKSLREKIEKNLNKGYHAFTTPSIQFIKKILDDAYESGLEYDVSDLYQRVAVFAMNSTHQAQYCTKLVEQMHFTSGGSERTEEAKDEVENNLVFFDFEVFPNLIILCYKRKRQPPISVTNPTPEFIEEFVKFPLVGFNNRRYDNHIAYAILLGMNNLEVFDISQRIVAGDESAFFREAYNLHYADVYEFSVKKQSLKKFELELGIHHQELGFDWDKPVPKESWDMVAEYCKNDVIATEAVFENRHADFEARKILSKLSGLAINVITSRHMAKILFGDDPHPESKFVYTDLSTEFPGYSFENGKSYYDYNFGGEFTEKRLIGEGGLAKGIPGTYTNVYVLDIASMHPSSLVALNYFGPYTDRFKELLDARIALKHNDKAKLAVLLNGLLVPFAEDDATRAALTYALKICINQVYGLTSASFPNKFKDPRNKDNIVAKRGELFMLKLLEELTMLEKAHERQIWCHVKTDSIKLIHPDEETIKFVEDFGAKYGYTFEVEAIYDRMCLIDKAQYIAYEEVNGEHVWSATGKCFDRPYVKKSIFTHEEITLDDLSETIEVHSGKGLYINSIGLGKPLYVGRVGAFTPVTVRADNANSFPEVIRNRSGEVQRLKDGVFSAPAGTKGYVFIETEVLKRFAEENGTSAIEYVDMSYYEKQAMDAKHKMLSVMNYETVYDSPSEYPPEDSIELFVKGSADEVAEFLATDTYADDLPF